MWLSIRHLESSKHALLLCRALQRATTPLRLQSIPSNHALLAGLPALCRAVHHKPHHVPLASKEPYTPVQRSGIAERQPSTAGRQTQCANTRVPVTYPSHQWSGQDLTEAEEREQLLSMVRTKLSPSIDTKVWPPVLAWCVWCKREAP